MGHCVRRLGPANATPMMPSPSIRVLLVALALVAVAPGPQGADGQDGRRLGTFRVPEYDARGVKKSNLTGESAIVRPDGNVDIQNLRIEFYEDDGEAVRMAVTAPACTYHQAGKLAKSPTAVRIEGDKMVVTGEDFAWDGQREVFKIFRNAKVVLKGARESVPLNRPSNPSSE